MSCQKRKEKCFLDYQIIFFNPKNKLSSFLWSDSLCITRLIKYLAILRRIHFRKNFSVIFWVLFSSFILSLFIHFSSHWVSFHHPSSSFHWYPSISCFIKKQSKICILSSSLLVSYAYLYPSPYTCRYSYVHSRYAASVLVILSDQWIKPNLSHCLIQWVSFGNWWRNVCHMRP